MRRQREHAWRFRIFRTNYKGEAIDCVGVYDDLASAKAHKRRSDWRYKVSVDGKWMTVQELDALEADRPQKGSALKAPGPLRLFKDFRVDSLLARFEGRGRAK